MSVGRSVRQSSRRYSVGTRNALHAICGGKCQNPDCCAPHVVRFATENNPTVTAEIAHIVASADDGPRADPSMPLEERDRFGNLLILCDVCHAMVDAPQNLGVYTVELLQNWRMAGLGAYAASLKRHIPRFELADLQAVCGHLVGQLSRPGYTDVHLIDPEQKMGINRIAPEFNALIQLGEMRQKRIQSFIREQEQLQPGYGNRLTGWFIQRYGVYYADHGKEEADVIYVRLYEDVRGSATGPLMEAVAASVLAYFFVECDIFQKE